MERPGEGEGTGSGQDRLVKIEKRCSGHRRTVRQRVSTMRDDALPFLVISPKA